MTGLFFRPKMTFFLHRLANFTKNNIFTVPYVYLQLYLCRLRKKKIVFVSASNLRQCGGVKVRAAKKHVAGEWLQCRHFKILFNKKNYPGNLNTWLNSSSKRFFLLPFLQPKKNVQKSMLLHWCCTLSRLYLLEH